MRPDLTEAIEAQALVHGLRADLVHAIVQVESAGDPTRWKVEPPYRYLFNVRTQLPFRRLTVAERASETAPRDFPAVRGLWDRDTEWWGQQASWGPMQVMGAVAREYGYRRPFPALCDPHVGVLWGCMHLKRLWRRFHRRHGVEGVIAAYNAGSPRKSGASWVNQGYVDKVTKRLA